MSLDSVLRSGDDGAVAGRRAFDSQGRRDAQAVEISFAVLSAGAVFVAVALAGFAIGKVLNLHGDAASALVYVDLAAAIILALGCLIAVLVRARRHGL
jgi:hypothetical protein